jgi:hypothetical protein
MRGRGQGRAGREDRLLIGGFENSRCYVREMKSAWVPFIPRNHEGLRIKLPSTMSGYHASDARGGRDLFLSHPANNERGELIIGIYYRDIHARCNALSSTHTRTSLSLSLSRSLGSLERHATSGVPMDCLVCTAA